MTQRRSRPHPLPPRLRRPLALPPQNSLHLFHRESRYYCERFGPSSSVIVVSQQNLFNQVQSSRTPQQTPRALEKQNTQSTLESLTAPPESTAANNETGDAIEEEEPAELPIIATPVTPVAPAQPAAQTVAAPRPSSPAGLTPHAFAEGSEGSISVEKFIIHPHPLRGFRQWIVRRKVFSELFTKYYCS